MEPGKAQSEYGLQPKKRFRQRSLSTQLAEALADAARLTKGKEKWTDEAAVSRMRLTQTRLVSLQKLLDRKQHEKTKKLTDANTRLKLEVEKLKLDLVAALAVRPVTARPLSAVEIALQNYEKEKNGG